MSSIVSFLKGSLTSYVLVASPASSLPLSPHVQMAAILLKLDEDTDAREDRGGSWGDMVVRQGALRFAISL